MAAKDSKTLIIRADADPKMGAGHVMRCLALAQAWKDSGGDVTFITACNDSWLLRQLHNEGLDIKLVPTGCADTADWRFTGEILASRPATWVVLDGYHFDEAYQDLVKKTNHLLLVTDSMAHLKHYCADLVLNQNLYAPKLLYSHEAYTHFLLGPEYIMLRREFRDWHNWRREIPDRTRRILVTLGGSDPHGQTAKVIAAVQRLECECEVVIVVGSSNPSAGIIKEQVAARRKGRPHLRLVKNGGNMAQLMASADIAITAGGITSREMCFMGLPMLLIVVADNQEANARMMHEMGLAENLGWWHTVTEELLFERTKSLVHSPSRRQHLSDTARQVVDGFGTDRVLLAMASRAP